MFLIKIILGDCLDYVFLSNDNLFVNKVLLEQGCADVMSSGQDLIYRRLLTSSRNQAITQRKGMWGACENQEEDAETIFPLEKMIFQLIQNVLSKAIFQSMDMVELIFLPAIQIMTE